MIIDFDHLFQTFSCKSSMWQLLLKLSYKISKNPPSRFIKVYVLNSAGHPMNMHNCHHTSLGDNEYHHGLLRVMYHSLMTFFQDECIEMKENKTENAFQPEDDE